jgi:hypothetical protein
MEFKDENFVEHTQSHEDGSNKSRNEEDMNFLNGWGGGGGGCNFIENYFFHTFCDI